MIEKVYQMTQSKEKIVEKIIQDENIHYIHMVFNLNEALPEHISNAIVYMTVIKGILSIGLNDQIVNTYDAGSVLKIPEGIKMNVKNLHQEMLELIIVKAPAPTK